MPQPQLRAVKPDEKPKSGPPQTLAEAVESGDPLAIALAQRRDIVQKLADASGPAAAALHRQLTLTSKEIDELKAAARVQAADEGTADDLTGDERFDASAI